jgi:hypothetical protein
MIWAYFWLYTLFLIIIWWIFIIIKIHAFKFKNFSNHIAKITYLLFLFLIILSIIWYVIIYISSSSSTFKLDMTGSNKDSYNKIEY